MWTERFFNEPKLFLLWHCFREPLKIFKSVCVSMVLFSYINTQVSGSTPQRQNYKCVLQEDVSCTAIVVQRQIQMQVQRQLKCNSTSWFSTLITDTQTHTRGCLSWFILNMFHERPKPDRACLCKMCQCGIFIFSKKCSSWWNTKSSRLYMTFVCPTWIT